jgi:hypothetical protein
VSEAVGPYQGAVWDMTNEAQCPHQQRPLLSLSAECPHTVAIQQKAAAFAQVIAGPSPQARNLS